jgi:two-component system response regulator VicR
MSLQTQKVLLIDDNESLGNIMQKYLTLKNHECTIANDGRKGLALMSEKDFDVVLLDLWMPELDGFDVIKALVKNGKINHQRVILFTVETLSQEAIDEVLSQGVHSYIIKPVPIDTLLKKIESA